MFFDSDDSTLGIRRVKIRRYCSKPSFTHVKANEYRDEALRDAFISGLISNATRRRLSEKKTLNLKGAVTQARALEIAQKNYEVYHSTEYRPTGAAVTLPNDDTLHESADTKCAASGQRPRNSQKCYFCGNSRHPRDACSAKDATCHRCQKKGHSAKLCQSPPSIHSPNVAAAMPKVASITCMTPSRPITSSVPNCLKQAQLPIAINNVSLFAQDNITIAGKSEEDHDDNLDQLNSVIKNLNLTLDPEQCVFSTSSVDLLGYTIAQGSINSNADRMKPLPRYATSHFQKSLG